MTALERVTALLERARVAGGWIDDIVAREVLAELGIDENGQFGTLEPPGDFIPDTPGPAKEA